MKPLTISLFLVASISLACGVSPAQPTSDVAVNVDWKSFLSRSDAVWTKLPHAWDDGVILGNGLLGSNIWQEGNEALHIEISRTDVYDHRNDYSATIGRCRLPIGHFTLQYKGTNPHGTMHLDLWDAEMRGRVETSTGAIRIRSFVHAVENVIVVDLAGEGEESADAWSWNPDTAKTTVTKAVPPEYTAYPLPESRNVDGVSVCVQPMPEGEVYRNVGKGVGQYATAWLPVKVGENRTICYISEGFSFPGETAEREAVDAVLKASRMGLPALESSHRQWWHAYYPKSFLSIPDARMESFYWLQMYKMASATRADRPVMDLLGPWFKPTGWPAIWWNLNIQLAYSPFFVSNHNDIASSLINVLDRNRPTLVKNAGYEDSYNLGRSCGIDLVRKPGNECADMTYALHDVWQQYRATMDDRMLREKLLPIMIGNFNYFRHIMKRESDGSYHIPKTGSPEYPGGEKVDDCNYTLALVKWLARSIVYACDRLGVKDPVRDECADVVRNMTPYPADSTGFLIGAGVPYAVAHRHWSHLFMVYPLYEYTYDDPAQIGIIERSRDHWLSMRDFRGFSRAGAASLYAMGGYGNEALKFLDMFFDPKESFPILPNTLCKHGTGPVIETPLAGARSIQDLVIQSANGIIRVFPAIPDSWRNVAFDKFRAEGAFLVSAKREDGATKFVRIESLAGEPCKVKTDLRRPLRAYGSRPVAVKESGNSVIEIDLRKGEWAVLTSAGDAGSAMIAPVAVSGPTNAWGTKAGNDPAK